MCNINFVDECNFGLEKFNGSDSISCSERQPRTSQKYFFNKPFSSTTNKENIFKELAVSVQSALTGLSKLHLVTKIALIRMNHSKKEISIGNLNLVDLVENISCSNSKFTHLLMQSLGCNSKICMLLDIFSLDEYCNKTLDSLRFASKVNHCRSDSAKRTRLLLQSTA